MSASFNFITLYIMGVLSNRGYAGHSLGHFQVPHAAIAIFTIGLSSSLLHFYLKKKTLYYILNVLRAQMFIKIGCKMCFYWNALLDTARIGLEIKCVSFCLSVQQVNATLIYLISALQLRSRHLAMIHLWHPPKNTHSAVITCIMQSVVIITVIAIRAGLESDPYCKFILLLIFD